MAVRVHHAVVFKTKVLHFKTENTPIKDTNGKRKFNGMLSFLFVDKRKHFAIKMVVFRKIQPCFVLHGGS